MLKIFFTILVIFQGVLFAHCDGCGTQKEHSHGTLKGNVKYQGKVENDQTIENAQSAARLCIVNGLSQIKAYFGTLDNIQKIVRISGFVNSNESFTEQPRVINTASDLLVDIFGEKGRHSRIAVGVSSLPLNATVEIDMIIETSD